MCVPCWVVEGPAGGGGEQLQYGQKQTCPEGRVASSASGFVLCLGEGSVRDL